MRTFLQITALSIGIWTASSCISPKTYRAEILRRTECEARERTLSEELIERRRESAEWAKRLAELGEHVGRLQAEKQQLEAVLIERTAALGASASQLLAEKEAAEQALSQTQRELKQAQLRLSSISEAQQARRAALEGLQKALIELYSGQKDIAIEIVDPAVLLTLPDARLFDKGGVLISPSGEQLLKPLATLLAQRPQVAAEVLAYTDDAVPKTLKNIEDTWQWSALRATNAVRTLVRQFNVNANQLTPVAKGEYYPVASNATEEGRSKNRRTVIALYPPLVKIPVWSGDRE